MPRASADLVARTVRARVRGAARALAFTARAPRALVRLMVYLLVNLAGAATPAMQREAIFEAAPGRG